MKQLDDETQCRYTPDAGEVEPPVYCGVCRDEMTLMVKGCLGPRGYAQAMSMHSRGETDTGQPHDIYMCPNTDELWHRQVKALREAARKSVSGLEDKALHEEARQVLEARRETKKLSSFYQFGV